MKSIRGLALALIGAFALLSAGAGFWQLADSRAKLRAVEWTQLANQLTDVAQRASARLALERGVTAAILGNPAEADPELLFELHGVRLLVDELHRQMWDLMGSLETRSADHPLFERVGDLQQSRAEMLRFRTLVDQQLLGVGNGLDAEQWIALMNRRIDELQSVAMRAMLPVKGNVYTLVSAPVIKDVLFTLGEYLGRERAMVGVAIARSLPLSEAELAQLHDYRVVALRARERAMAMTQNLPASEELQLAYQRMEHDLLASYETLRASVYASVFEGRPYPLDAMQWYQGATVGIDSVLGLSLAVSNQFALDIMQLRKHAERTLILLSLAFVMLLVMLWFTVRTVRGRVLRPLRTLEKAAATISHGDLSQALPPMRDDELGRLGRAFEHMRKTLLGDIERRERDAVQLRKFMALIEHSASAMIVTDREGIVEYANRQFTKVTGYEREESVGRKAGFWRSGMTAASQ